MVISSIPVQDKITIPPQPVAVDAMPVTPALQNDLWTDPAHFHTTVFLDHPGDVRKFFDEGQDPASGGKIID